jgi:hypothetical protein
MRTRERYAAVHRLLAGGVSLGAIASQLNLDRSTVRRFARASSVDELLTKAVNRTRLLDGYTDHLTTRLAAGITDAVTLYAELPALGFTGSVQTVRRYLRPLRATAPTTPYTVPLRPAVPKPRQVVRWIMTEPDKLDPDEQAPTHRRTRRVPAPAGHHQPCPQLRRPDAQAPRRAATTVDATV